MNVRERMALTIAATTYPNIGRRQDAIVEQLGMTPTRHAQVVAALLDRPDAEAEMPTEVHRLRRIREEREGARTAGGYVVPT